MPFINLNPCDGAECPECGCTDTEIKSLRGRWGATFRQWLCLHCGKKFAAPEPDKSKPSVEPKHHVVDPDRPAMVIYPLIRCPVDQGGCGSTNTKVTSTRRPKRHHKCKDCGNTFKSMEED